MTGNDIFIEDRTLTGSYVYSGRPALGGYVDDIIEEIRAELLVTPSFVSTTPEGGEKQDWFTVILPTSVQSDLAAVEMSLVIDRIILKVTGAPLVYSRLSGMLPGHGPLPTIAQLVHVLRGGPSWFQVVVNVDIDSTDLVTLGVATDLLDRTINHVGRGLDNSSWLPAGVEGLKGEERRYVATKIRHFVSLESAQNVHDALVALASEPGVLSGAKINILSRDSRKAGTWVTHQVTSVTN